MPCTSTRRRSLPGSAKPGQQEAAPSRAWHAARPRPPARTQVCPEFLNAVILREPVPHAISLLAEVQYRYVRQLVLRRNITAWAPPAWNLTW